MQNFTTDVSVIIPAYNPGMFLDEALASVRAQTSPPREIIVIDDGSTPPVSVSRFADLPIRLIRQANAGQASARNLGIRKARSGWLAFLDADDIWHPQKLERQLHIAAENPRLSIIGCRAILVDASGHSIGSGPGNISTTISFLDRRQFQLGAARALLVPSMAIVSRAAALSSAGFEPRYQPIEDLAFFDSLFAAGAEAAISEEPLLKRRIHGSSLTLKYRQMLMSYLRWIADFVRPCAQPLHVAAVTAEVYLVTGLSALACGRSDHARLLLRRARYSGASLASVLIPLCFTFLPSSMTQLARRLKQSLSGKRALQNWCEDASGPEPC